MASAPPSTDATALQERVSMSSLRTNTITLQYARSSLAFISGAAAGILGLEGWLHGGLFYIFCSLLMSLVLWARTGFTPKTYFPTVDAIWIQEVGGNAFSYLLFWTLAYGLVYVYD